MSVTEMEMEAQDKEGLVRPSIRKSDTSYKWYDIDTGMLSSKASYFFQTAKDSCYLPYMILFLTGIGLSKDQAGMVNGLRFLGFIVGAPLWGVLADYKHIHHLVIFILCVSSLLFISSQPFLSIPLSDKSVCERNKFNQSLFSNKTMNQSVNVNLTSSVNATVTTINYESSRQRRNTLFIIMMVINLLGSCFDGSTAGFVDAGVIQKISVSARPAQFGTQRFFGAIGGIGALTSSIAIEYFPRSILPCYTAVFIVYGVFILSLTFSTFSLFNSIAFTSEIKKRSASVTSDIYTESVDVGTLLRRTVCEFHTMFFLVTVLVVGTIHSLYISFLFLLLKQINCPNIVMGLSIFVGSLTSALCIKLCQNFIDLLGGTIRVLCLGTVSWAIRFLLFTYLVNPWYVLLIQLLHGLGFGLFLATSVVHIRIISSPDIYTSMYGIFNGLFYGAGAVFGNVIGGELLMRYDIQTLFLGTSVAGFSWTFVMLIYVVIRAWQQR